MTRASFERPSSRATLERIFRHALAAVDPARAVEAVFEGEGAGLRISGERLPEGARLRVLAAGKAAGRMAAAVERRAGARIGAGLAVTKDGHGEPLSRIASCEAGHPVPDARSEAAGRAMLALAADGEPSDVLLVLLSGGASALLATPLPGLSREDVAATTSLLLASGAEIGELNCVRKHLCDVGGGRLARAAGGRRVMLLAISDVLGDPLDVIGSGPCVPDPTTYADARDVLDRRGLAGRVPERIRAHLEAGVRGARPESAKPGEPCFSDVSVRVLASNRVALEAAGEAGRAEGLAPIVADAALRGEARDAGARLAAQARALRTPGPALLLAGGETTVTLRGDGRGGRNQELALAAAIALEGDARVTLLAAGTDGTDGPTDAAGAFADGGTVARGRSRGVDAHDALRRNDSHAFFRAEGGLFVTGPTGTNVMDLVLTRVEPA